MSVEERYRHFFFALMEWRKCLLSLSDVLGRVGVSGDTSERCTDVVAGWVRKLDWMAGACAVKAEYGSSRGASPMFDGSFDGLVADHFQLGPDANPERYLSERERKRGTLEWWLDDVDYSKTAEMLQSGRRHHRGLDTLAKWWDCYSRVPAVARYLWYYEDDAFPEEVRDCFLTLVGEMVNRRYDVCFGYHCADEAVRAERYLLLKHRAVRVRLDAAACKLKGAEYFDEPFDVDAVYEEVAGMTARELKALFDEEVERVVEGQRSFAAASAKKEESRADGLFGAQPEPSTPAKVKTRKASGRRRGKR